MSLFGGLFWGTPFQPVHAPQIVAPEPTPVPLDELQDLRQRLLNRAGGIERLLGYPGAAAEIRAAVQIIDDVISARDSKSLREAGYG